MNAGVLAGGRATETIASEVLVPLQLFSGDFLQLAIVFFVLALVAALVGARGVAGISMEIAKWFIIIFVVLAIVSLVL
ncbi:MAG: DUF1328 domain-containing protein [Halobacteriales archaeon]|nr:DUF1328 domain-containing protein [Halobacteriales archaeon]